MTDWKLYNKDRYGKESILTSLWAECHDLYSSTLFLLFLNLTLKGISACIVTTESFHKEIWAIMSKICKSQVYALDIIAHLSWLENTVVTVLIALALNFYLYLTDKLKSFMLLKPNLQSQLRQISNKLQSFHFYLKPSSYSFLSYQKLFVIQYANESINVFLILPPRMKSKNTTALLKPLKHINERNLELVDLSFLELFFLFMFGCCIFILLFSFVWSLIFIYIQWRQRFLYRR